MIEIAGVVTGVVVGAALLLSALYAARRVVGRRARTPVGGGGSLGGSPPNGGATRGLVAENAANLTWGLFVLGGLVTLVLAPFILGFAALVFVVPVAVLRTLKAA